MAAGAWALAWFIVQRTGSIAAGAAAAALLLVNPNVLYLPSTPMTEPLLFGTTLVAVALVADWVDRGAPDWPRAAGLAVAAACMTRYEAWPVCATLVALAFAVLLRRGTTPRAATMAIARLAGYPAVAIALFLLNSRWTVRLVCQRRVFCCGERCDRPAATLLGSGNEGVYRLSGPALVWPAYGGAALIAWTFTRSRSLASMVLVLALVGAAALPWYAYFEGHPFRIRYGVPLVVACAALVGAGISLLPRVLRAGAAIVAVAAAIWQVSPLDRTAPVIVESQRDAQDMVGRRAVTAYLRTHHDGRPIMMSMGSLAHYMHDLSLEGFDIHDFLQEGNGEVWVSAMQYRTSRVREVGGD